MSDSADYEYAHPEVEGRPVLIGDRLKARVDIDSADGWGPFYQDVEFGVTSIHWEPPCPGVSSEPYFLYGADDGEEYYSREVTGRAVGREMTDG